MQVALLLAERFINCFLPGELGGYGGGVQQLPLISSSLCPFWSKLAVLLLIQNSQEPMGLPGMSQGFAPLDKRLRLLILKCYYHCEIIITQFPTWKVFFCKIWIHKSKSEMLAQVLIVIMKRDSEIWFWMQSLGTVAALAVDWLFVSHHGSSHMMNKNVIKHHSLPHFENHWLEINYKISCMWIR